MSFLGTGPVSRIGAARGAGFSTLMPEGMIVIDDVTECLIYSDIPAAQGGAAKIDCGKQLILCKNENRTFRFFAL
jgi:hypothetical protein